MSFRETLEASRLSRQARKAAAGDARAFTALYRALHPVVWGYLGRRLDGRADVEDLVGRTFGRVVEHLHRFDPERGNVRAWVIGIARNALIDHLRAQHARGTEDDALARLADASLDPADVLVARERDAELHARLAECSPAVREMLALRFADGLRVREIAVIMGLSEAATKQRFARALRELRSRLGEHAPHGRALEPAPVGERPRASESKKKKGATGYAI